MASNCFPCILDRAKFECDLVFSEEPAKRAAMEELLDYMACHKGGVPALVGTERERIIKRRSGSIDPYFVLKDESNRLAKRLLPIAEQFYSKSENKLEALIRIAAAANSMEFGVKGHDFSNSTFGNCFAKTLEERLEGDLDKVKSLLDGFRNIFYLTDNSGEVIFDLFVISKLKDMNKRVIIGSKSEPILNDVTADELRGLTDNEIISTGAVVGTSLECISPDALALLLDKEWLVISKGMGNFETMSEFEEKLKGRLIYIMRAKCEPVANKLGVPRGTLVAKTIDQR
ncbi:MAG: ARMT1-like domain-containing protein [Methanotrichaceae archaeon]